MKQLQKPMFMWIAALLLFMGMLQMMGAQPNLTKELTFSEFLEAVKGGSVQSVQIENDEYRGKFSGGGEFVTVGPIHSERALDILTASDVELSYERQNNTPFWQQIIFSWLPTILLFGFFFYSMRQLQASGGKAMSFGRSKAKLLQDQQKKVTFEDVAGIEEAKEELEEIIEFLKDPKRFTRLGGRIPKGVLLMGSPGTGKTLLARAIAGEADVPFFSMSGSDFVEMFVGVGASRVRDLFEQGKKNAPCIVFIDEIDAVGRSRGAGLGGGHDEREQTLNQLLVEMDGFESSEGVIIVAATNRPDVLDPALLRPGRFDRRVIVPRPDVKGREGILNVHAKRLQLATGVDLHAIARGTPGFSGADLESVVNEAALLAARDRKDSVSQGYFELAKDKVMMGSERRSMIITPEEKKITAYHEAGHAIVGKLLPKSDPVHKVTIIPRGQALGLTQYLPTDDRYTRDRGYCEAHLAVSMGGRAAEEIIFSSRTSGAGGDIQTATDLAKRMVCEWGMSEKLGPLAFGKKDDNVFLGKEIGKSADYSDDTARAIDAEVSRLVNDSYAEAKRLLEENVDVLHAMADALLEYETIDADQVEQLMKREKVSPPAETAKRTQDNSADGTGPDATHSGLDDVPTMHVDPEPGTT